MISLFINYELLYRDKMIDVMIIGDELEYVKQLLNHVASTYCQRYIRFSTNLTLSNTTRRDDGIQWVDGKCLCIST